MRALFLGMLFAVSIGWVSAVAAGEDSAAAEEDSTTTEDGLSPSSTESAGLFPEQLGPLPIDKVPHFLASLSAQSCNSCHRDIHDQWAQSGHSTASSNAVYRAATKSLGAPDLCDECHKPLQQQRRYIQRGPAGGSEAHAPNPAWDPILDLEGVTCVACHLRGDSLIGPRELRVGQAPHPVTRDDRLSGPEACSYCHQLALEGAEEHPFLDTLGEWASSPQGQAGITCQDCHMPRESGVIAGSRYAAFANHGMTEGRSPSALAAALLLRLDMKEAVVQRGSAFRATAALANVGAGHAVPTGDPNHRLELRFSAEDSRGKKPRGVKSSSLWMGREVSATPPFEQLSDTQLDPGESRSLDYRFVPHRKSPPGDWTLLVEVYWWSVGPERAKEIGVSREDASIQILERRIPFEVN